jgi:hypothetical protein
MSTSSLFNNPPLQAPPSARPASAPPQAPMIAAPASQSLVPLTQDDIKQALPVHLRASVTQQMADTLNTLTTDPLAAENIRANFVGYSTVLKEGKFKTEDYIHAVAYVSYKLMGYSNQDAYARAFPQRYASLLARGSSSKDISAYVSAYHRGKLVNLIMEQSLVPIWVLNQDLAQKAINQLATLMVSANSEKVQADAAIGLLNHLKKPEPKGDFQININPEESNGMKEMREAMSQLARQQRDMIAGGQMKTIDIAASKLINREDATDVE